MRKQGILKKYISFFLPLVFLFLLSSCEGTVVSETKTETLYKVFEIEYETDEELLEKINALPDTIEVDGKIYKRVGDPVINDIEHFDGELTVSYETTITSDDPVYNHWGEIVSAVTRYGLYVLAGIAVLILLSRLFKLIRNWYDLWQ